jgi:hypothetical protein
MDSPLFVFSHFSPPFYTSIQFPGEKKRHLFLDSGLVVSVYSFRAEGRLFESPSGSEQLGMFTMQCCRFSFDCIVAVK